jgi:H(+)-transporting ATP synthase subunit D
MAANRGILLRLKEQLEFMQKSLEILKMRRDQLVSEMSKFLNEIKKRKTIEKQLMDAYSKIADTYAVLGYSGTASVAACVDDLKAEIKAISAMGVALPELNIEQKPKLTSISNAVAYDAATKLSSATEELFKVSKLETWTEVTAKELMTTNRKVNALEKALIPSLIDRITYVEGKMEEEELEEFFRAKRIRNILRRTES